MIQLTDNTFVTDEEEKILEIIWDILVVRSKLKMSKEEAKTTAGIKRLVVLAAAKISLPEL
ncbi:MAG: hypothetical protein NTX66_04020, partial [Candidatus Falkowbacteria bacterium]|nr:hypothetical protein [Candidatus Falkowbacteria bacterium]